MKEFGIKIFFVLIVATIAWLTNDKKSWWAFIIVGITPFLLYDIILGKVSDPKPKVSLERVKDTLNVSVLSDKPVVLLDIDLPISGEVTKWYDFKESGDANISRVVNHKSTLITNGKELHPSFIQIHIKDLVPKRKCRYVLEIKPIDNSIASLPTTDNYKVSYQWDFNGNRKAKTNWFSLKTGEIVKQPAVWQGLYTASN